MKKDLKHRDEYKDLNKIKDKGIKDMYSEYLMKMGHQEEIKQGIARIEKSISPAKQKPSSNKTLVLNETIDSIKK